MKRAMLTLALCMCAVLISCAETPENVKEQAEILDNAGQSISSTSQQNNDNSSNDVEYVEQKEYADLDGIRQQLQTDLQLNSTQIYVDSARVSSSEYMPSYNCKLCGINITDAENNSAMNVLAEYIFGESPTEANFSFSAKDDPLDPQYIATDRPSDINGDGRIEMPNSNGIDILTYYQNSDNITKAVYAYSTGNVWGSSDGFVDNQYYWFEEALSYECYNVLNEQVDDSVCYTMTDGSEWSINDAVEYYENFYNDYLSAFDKTNLTYRVQKVDVRKFDDGKFGYLFEFICIDEYGNYFDSEAYYDFYDTDTAEMIASENPFPYVVYSYAFSWKKESVGRFVKDTSYDELEITSENETLLTLSGAINILSQTLASQKALSIPCAELNYTLVCKGYPYYRLWDWSLSDGDIFIDRLCENSCEFELRPTWVFRTKYALDDYDNGECYWVDAVTGEVLIIR